MNTGWRLRTVILCIIALFLFFVGAMLIISGTKQSGNDTFSQGMWCLVGYSILSLFLMADFPWYRACLVLQGPLSILCSPMISIPICLAVLAIGLALSPIFLVTRLIWNLLCLLCSLLGVTLSHASGGGKFILCIITLIACGLMALFFHLNSPASNTGNSPIIGSYPSSSIVPENNTNVNKPAPEYPPTAVIPPSTPQRPEDLLKPDEKHEDPVCIFHRCISSFDIERIHAFIAAGININKTINYTFLERNALQHSVYVLNYEATKALIQAGADVDIPAFYLPSGESAQTTLLKSVIDTEAEPGMAFERIKILKLLMEHGATEYTWKGHSICGYFFYVLLLVSIPAFIADIVTRLYGRFKNTIIMISSDEPLFWYICIGLFILGLWHGSYFLHILDI